MELALFILVGSIFFSLGYTQGKTKWQEQIDRAWVEGYQLGKKEARRENIND